MIEMPRRAKEFDLYDFTFMNNYVNSVKARTAPPPQDGRHTAAQLRVLYEIADRISKAVGAHVLPDFTADDVGLINKCGAALINSKKPDHVELGRRLLTIATKMESFRVPPG